MNPTMLIKQGQEIEDLYSESDARLNPINVFLKLELMNNANILDAGCGCGWVSDYVQRKNSSNKVVGVDTYANDFTYARRKNKYIDYYVEDAVALTIPDNTFDLVISNQVLEHVFSGRRHIEETKRVLKDRGKLLLTTPNWWFPFDFHYDLPLVNFVPVSIIGLFTKPKFVKLYSRRKTMNLLRKNGFVITTDIMKEWIINPRGLYFGCSVPRRISKYFIYSLHILYVLSPLKRLYLKIALHFLPQYYIAEVHK